MLENDTLIRALLRQPTPYTPVWLMRQAGRYLPEYNATRARAGDFLSLCKTPALATEVTLQPLARFPLDAAILFSDILTIPDAMGLGLSFAEGEGPRFARPVRDERAIGRLAVPDPHGELRYVVDAVAEIRRALRGRVPLIGFAGSPFTLACYMIEGGSSDDFRTVKQMLYQRPDLLHRLLDVNARAVAAYLNAQIEAGADAVMVFDTWGGTLAHAAYLGSRCTDPRRRRAPARARRASACRASCSPRAAAPGSRRSRPAAATRSASTGRSASRRPRRVGARVAIQGNLDPLVLLTDPDTVRHEAARTFARPAARRGTSSTSVTASCPRRRRTTWRRWSKRCTRPRAQAAPLLDLRHTP